MVNGCRFHIPVLVLSVALSILAGAVHPASAQGQDCRPGLPEPVMTDADIAATQKSLAELPVGERIAFWADKFIGTPYDTDPLGKYVRTERVVCDSEVDCMYLVFRAVELATSDSPKAAVQRALELRFRTRGVVKDGRVTNYDERFEYAEDMIASGKWGADITARLGDAQDIPGARGRDRIAILNVSELSRPDVLARLRDGDIIYFVKDPARRVVGEVVGHLGIIKVENGAAMLVHASGSKSRPDRPGGGSVKKVELADYLSDTKFIGAQFTRFK